MRSWYRFLPQPPVDVFYDYVFSLLICVRGLIHAYVYAFIHDISLCTCNIKLKFTELSKIKAYYSFRALLNSLFAGTQYCSWSLWVDWWRLRWYHFKFLCWYLFLLAGLVCRRKRKYVLLFFPPLFNSKINSGWKISQLPLSLFPG